ncbi:MAG TPA: cupin domain-containing protein [Bacteroidia bacterium]|nr:cupin domain-containing protein [Bacteroidia bacterium]
MKNSQQAQLVLSSTDLQKEMSFFTKIGFRLDQIYPADNPQVAIMSGYNISLKIDLKSNAEKATIHILADNPEKVNEGKLSFTAPNGTTFKIFPTSVPLTIPKAPQKFEVRKMSGNETWIIGRAGMLYRDLIPDRLNGSIIASHIHIPKGGPVPDMVHYHTVGFQLIFCYNGWVKIVYEDQGEPFILNAGDCLIQPPEIRHRVLEASDDLQVIEIGVPAEHITTIDYEMELPNAIYNPERKFNGQKFCRHIEKEAKWQLWKCENFIFRDTGIAENSNGVASVIVAKPTNKSTTNKTVHQTNILFCFVMNGKTTLEVDGYPATNLAKGDAFVIPQNTNYQFSEFDTNLELLEVSIL